MASQHLCKMGPFLIAVELQKRIAMALSGIPGLSVVISTAERALSAPSGHMQVLRSQEWGLKTSLMLNRKWFEVNRNTFSLDTTQYLVSGD